MLCGGIEGKIEMKKNIFYKLKNKHHDQINCPVRTPNRRTGV